MAWWSVPFSLALLNKNTFSRTQNKYSQEHLPKHLQNNTYFQNEINDFFSRTDLYRSFQVFNSDKTRGENISQYRFPLEMCILEEGLELKSQTRTPTKYSMLYCTCYKMLFRFNKHGWQIASLLDPYYKTHTMVSKFRNYGVMEKESC